jgi:polyphosphate kinase
MNLPESYPYFNRDLSWLKFNERVLFQAQDSRVPLLERVRFLSIFSSNMDEFFMKRIGHLKRLESRAIPQVGTDHLPPSHVLKTVRDDIVKQIEMRRICYDKLTSDLQKQKIQFLKWSDLTEDEKSSAKDYFMNKVFPVLTPLAVDKSHPFPFLSNLSVSLGIMLSRPKNNETLFARVKIPDVLPQWLQIHMSGEKGYRLVRLIDVISANLNELFPEMNIQNIMPFRVTRNAEIHDEIEDEEIEDQLDLVEEELRLRRVAKIVRLEYTPASDDSMLKYLRDELELKDEDLYPISGELSYNSLNEIANLNLPNLRYRPFSPTKPLALRDPNENIFSAIKAKDILVHCPFESFSDSVERFIQEAVDDPDVLAIKITLYRAGENNPIIPLLIAAAEMGKQVVCVVELKARFDEARNIRWGEMLEEAGVHVVYGVSGKKVHSKTILVIRKEGDSYCFYSHVGTGNYNSTTAKLYTDLSLFTADKRIGNELIEVFNFLTGLSLKKNYQKLMVAPVNMRKRIVQYIKKEIELAKAGEVAHIVAKMNSLEDQEVCDLLYQASQAGVKVDLIVRGFCCLRPGLKGISENIRVMSVIGRFLEHSRVFYFRRGAKDPLGGRFYIGSADWMYRNLNNRIETVAPVEEIGATTYLWNLLQRILNDRTQTWDLQPNGEYILRRPEPGTPKSEDRTIHDDYMLLHERTDSK